MTVVFSAHEGFLYPDTSAQFVLEFALSAAMGFDRPWWPWTLIVLPLLIENTIAPLLFGSGVELVMIGATSIFLRLVLRQGWEQNEVTPTAAPHLIE